MTQEIRSFHASDLFRLHEICLQTGANGDDASGTVDAELPGHIYAAPYAVSEPEQCFVLTRFGDPIGYILGTLNSGMFAEYFNNIWRPPLLARYPVPSDSDNSYQAQMIRRLHLGYIVPDLATDYPAHLHIDILPVGQGLGMGRSLMETFLKRLKSKNIQGVHFAVSKLNSKAIGFYRHLGFEEIKDSTESIIFGKKLS